MGKGYNNYMCKKPFHPGSKANIKRAWMAEQKTQNEKNKQDELKVQYEKEQDLYNNRALLSTESKDKLELNFMYEAPPGAKRERQKEDDEPEFKFEWQRKYNAPREDYAKGNSDIKDQPFGIPVRNVRCIKCHNWGHINTDKECPLFSQASTSSMPTTSMDPMELMKQMREDGFGLKENVLGHQLNPKAANQQFIASEESDPEMDFLKSLSSSEKKKLLKKLKKLSRKQEKSSNCKKKSKKSDKSKSKDRHSKKSKKKKESSNESDSESSNDDSPPEKEKKKSHLKSRKRNSSPSSSSESESEKEISKHSKHKRSKHDQKHSLRSESCTKKEERVERDNKHKKHKTKSQNEFKTIESKLSNEEKTEKRKNPKLAKSFSNDRCHSENSFSDSEDETNSRHSHKKLSRKITSSDKSVYEKRSPKSESNTRKDSHSKSLLAAKQDSKSKSLEDSDNKSSNDHLSKSSFKSPTVEAKDSESKKSSHKDSESHSDKFSSSDSEIDKKPSTSKITIDPLGKPSSESKKRKIGDIMDENKSESSKINAKMESSCKETLKKESSKTDPESKKKRISLVEKAKCDSPMHPDGFSHICPQALIEANYVQTTKEYQGNIDDNFRDHYRSVRSPSVKQKYH